MENKKTTGKSSLVLASGVFDDQGEILEQNGSLDNLKGILRAEIGKYFSELLKTEVLGVKRVKHIASFVSIDKYRLGIKTIGEGLRVFVIVEMIPNEVVTPFVYKILTELEKKVNQERLKGV
ncbi:MAG: hypothetical protein QMD50_03150 [Patescibacteria group bacterium]|nr:hypothetical protein [Patescibacteria group bacterium]